jgi:hypothetical protein
LVICGSWLSATISCKTNLRKFSFTNRIVDLWNTLPQSVIDAMDVRQFEIRLDKYWEHKDVKFEYKASIQNKENSTGIY